MTYQVNKILLLSYEKLPTPLAGVLGVVLVLIGVLLHLLLILKDLTTLKAHNLTAHSVFGKVSPQAWLLNKLSGTELAMIIFLSSRNVMDRLEVGY